MSTAPSRQIPLHRRGGHVAAHALVDPEDHDWLDQWSFCRSGHVRDYARTTVTDPVTKRKRGLRMHRMIMERYHGALGDREIDHINGDTLDNRKANLRITDRRGNMANQHKRVETQSGYKGVYPMGTMYRAGLGSGDTKAYLGTFSTALDAAIAYDLAARDAFGEYACLNLPTICPEDEARVRARMANPKKKRGSSRYRGVSRSHGKWWRAAIHVNGCAVKLGSFDTEEAAALAYNEAALKRWGSKARLNTVLS